MFDIKISYQTDSPVESADSPAAISKVQRNPIPRNILRYIRNLNRDKNVKSVAMVLIIKGLAKLTKIYLHTFQQYHFYRLV